MNTEQSWRQSWLQWVSSLWFSGWHPFRNIFHIISCRRTMLALKKKKVGMCHFNHSILSLSEPSSLCSHHTFFLKSSALLDSLLTRWEVKWSESRSVVSDSLWLHGVLQARTLEWVAFPFSRRSSQPGDQTQVSHIAGGLFTSWATREAQEYWSGWSIPSPVDLPDLGIEPGSPELQADS